MTESTPPTKILLVDDLTENLAALEALLRQPNLVILQANSGKAALELLLDHDVAVAFIDVHMPEMDGFTLAELMRGTKRTHHIPIIFVTAGSWESHRVFRGYDAGAVDVLFKPIDADILRHKARTFITLHQQKLELEVRVEALEKQEAETRALKDDLSATLHLNETFLAMVSHDLKTPLSAILMATELQLASADLNSHRRAAERTRSSARRMAHMIEQLFELARSRVGGGLEPNLQPNVDLSSLAKELIHELEAANPDRSVMLRVEGDPCGTWDEGGISRVLSNLLGNAVRHGTPGTPIELIIDGTMVADVTFRVASDGEVPRDVLPTLFEPYRENSAQRKHREGLGLGLYIVWQVTRAHGGDVEVDSRDGRATFRVKLPREARYTPTEPLSLPELS